MRSGFSLLGRVVACSIASVVACGHDDFPGRLKRGCSSGDDCVRLIADGRIRLLDCVQVQRDYDTSPAYNWRRVDGVCSYEFADFKSALEIGWQWATWAKAPQGITKRILWLAALPFDQTMPPPIMVTPRSRLDHVSGTPVTPASTAR